MILFNSLARPTRYWSIWICLPKDMQNKHGPPIRLLISRMQISDGSAYLLCTTRRQAAQAGDAGADNRVFLCSAALRPVPCYASSTRRGHDEAPTRKLSFSTTGLFHDHLSHHDPLSYH